MSSVSVFFAFNDSFFTWYVFSSHSMIRFCFLVIFQFLVIRFMFFIHFYWFVHVFSSFFLTTDVTLRRMTNMTTSTEHVIISSQVLRDTSGRLRDFARQKELGIAITEARWGDYQGNVSETTPSCRLRICVPIVCVKKKTIYNNKNCCESSFGARLSV